MKAPYRPPVEVGAFPLCGEDPELFDSLNPAKHVEARKSCAVCFSRSSCRLYAIGNPDATGTYGGDLFDGGKWLALP